MIQSLTPHLCPSFVNVSSSIQQHVSTWEADGYAQPTSELQSQETACRYRQTPRDTFSHLPSCKEYSRSKVTSHMPLKAVIFHRNVVQSPRRVHGAAVGQARLRAGLVLLMLPGGGLSSPGPTLCNAEKRAAEKVPPLLPALSSPHRDRLLSPHPPYPSDAP